ncbi:MFS transporter [Mycoplasma mycoides subsp. mycoides]|uniref:Transmembrane protein n=2 Tax=Mycoplasma mycoides subsp. mycoides TaxID=2103 RepID=A0AAE2EHJ2_MYCMY|nr:MFS transporter [Mycoplasma mycoides]CAE77161.1 Hypothetical transmembrane protein [Mycoplasma mycoides subsp. mycoides SC str. PG1]ADK69871.1 conserved hypothetical protein [Mycoplasma mycoides subsp. mycoides SC str. Gladysdale]AIZ55392.1 transmembrane protein [Mycoplasma mycoides subsp. mycoides]AME10746.1 hypothetical protein MmmBen_0581 [Mycoplasma mycoides subsp. mycoides]AME11754.1 hypothetical protein MmmBen50_0569 [Mycoplasma mycoides subsp. mycoides]
MENKINHKTYKTLKYLLTISSVILAICLLLVFVQFTKAKPLFISLTPFISLLVILLILSFTCLLVYIIYRVKILKTSNYKYIKKEIIYLYTSFSLYIFSFILTVIYLIIALLIKNSESIRIMFYVVISIFFICIILSSVFETLSRLKEQILLYKQEYQSQQELKLNKEIDKKEQINKEVINNNNNQSKNPFIED